ncbi:hypothetical protein EAO27_18415 [Sphingopyxis sp. YF1]|uniref:pertactin-like passenger domain-containing protein n=1 Tax=Sphingopyxis sp. YF1 TaxID=2482763 RepID=UPI001F61543B|nr:pertactin-like passenger domain-containing protein [Sphingopyxis sp. YF1]UNU44462.1 hypothetical protein EAO27_18415 [Sphingopyxis sp. YF1]
MQHFKGLAAASRHHVTSSHRVRLGLGTCLAGAAAALLLGAAPARAENADISVLRAPLHRLPATQTARLAGDEPQDLTLHLDPGTLVETDADYEHGITLTNFAGGSVLVDAEGVTVATAGSGSIGAVAIATDGNAEIRIGDVRTGGTEAHGVVAGSANGSVRVTTGSIATTGDAAIGIHATGYAGPVDVTAVSVQTSGSYATGIHAMSGGDVAIDVGSILTGGDYAVGIQAQAGQRPVFDEETGQPILSAPADLSIRADSIETRGYASDGVIATNFTKGRTSVEVGSIRTEGDNSWGAYAGGFGDVALHAGTVETGGDGAVGLGAVSFGGEISVSGDSVVTRGDFSTGINVLSYDFTQPTTITVGSVETHGNASTGIYMGGAYFEGNEAQVLTINADKVTTHGTASTAVAVLTGGDVTMDLGAVLAEGDRSRGVVINNGLGDINLTVDSIVTKGRSQFGRDTAGLVISNNHGTVNAAIGSIETSGSNAPAVLTNGYDTDQRFTISGGLTTSGDHATAFQAFVDTGSLSLDAGAITTKGSDSHGVFASVRSGDVSIRTGTIDTAGDGSAGIIAQAASYDGTVHAITIDAGSIATHGENAKGVNVLALGGSADIKAGTISTAGDAASGIKAIAVSGFDSNGRPFGGDLAIEVGEISTGGDDAPGIDATAYGSVTIDAGKISTGGTNSAGIKALAYGDIDIDAGTVETRGDHSDGIFANSNVGGYSGSIKITAGEVTTSGEGSTAIRATAYYGSTSVKVDKVTTGGIGADGIYAWSYWGDSKVEAGSVMTSGEGARGITAYSGGTTTVIAGDVTTSGGGTSSDFDAGAIKAVGASVVVKAGNVSTKGDFSSGIYANSNMVHDNGQVSRDISIAAGDIATEGFASHGVVAINQARRANVDIDVGNVKTKGDYSVGIYALAPAGDIAVKADSVATEGLQSVGVVAISNYGDIGIDLGAVTTSGDGAVGIYAYSGGGPRAGAATASIKADSIATSGDYASGVVAIGLGKDNAINVDVGSVSTEGTASRGIFAYGLGDMTVTAGKVETRGDGATGIEAFSFGGDINVTAGSIATEGDLAAGVYASTLSGDVSIETGDITTRGDLSQGVRAYSRTGDVQVTGKGHIATNGTGSYGILAFGSSNITIDNNGAVETHGDFAHGLYALGRGDGATTVTNSGSVTVTGAGSAGIRALASNAGAGIKVSSTGSINALGDYTAGVVAVIPRSRDAGGPAKSMIDIDVSKVTVTGNATTGILGLNYSGDVHIRAGSVALDGKGIGISAIAAGSITVDTGGIKSGGRGVILVSGAGSTLNVTGDIVAPNHVAVEMGSGSGQSVLNVAKGATIIGGGKRNPADGSYTGPGNAVILGSDTGVVVHNAGTIRNLGDRYTIFVADHYDSDWQPIPWTGAQIENSGVIEGNLRLTAGDDVTTNSGIFVATRDSVFGEGDDLFTNSGVLRIGAAGVTARAAPGATGLSVRFDGLDRFENSGLVDLRNGTVGDTLVLPGTFTGSGGSTLALDIGSGTADRLVIEGAATGTTNIVVGAAPSEATLFAGSVEIIKVGAGSDANAFTMTGSDAGFVRYDMRFDSATGTYGVTSAAGSSVYRLAKLNEGVRAIGDQSAKAWSTHMAELRDAGDGAKRLWGQMYGHVTNRDGRLGTASLDYRQDFFGGQLGYDVGGRESDDSTLLFGVTGGYLGSHQRFEDGNERARFNTLSFGAYASYRSDRLFANLFGQYAHVNVAARGGPAADAWSDDSNGDLFGAQAEFGARFGSDRMFVEPVVSLTWQSGSMGSVHAYGQTVAFDDDSALTARIGGRLGAELQLGGESKGVIYARANYVDAIGGKAGVLFTSGGVSQSIDAPDAKGFAEAAVGLNIVSTGPLSGFIEGDAALGGGAKGGGGRVGIRFKF